MANKPFDETLFWVLEGEDPAAGAAALKMRLDRDPEAAALFERQKRTVLALHDLAPKPKEPKGSTFDQRDMDKLTREILKGYKSKLAEIYYQLGTAYLMEVPQKCFAILRPHALKSIEESSASRDYLFRSGGSIAGSAVGFRKAIGVLESTGPEETLDSAERSLDSLNQARVLRPRHAMTWIRESQALARNHRLSESRSRAKVAQELAQGPFEEQAALMRIFGIHYGQEEFSSALSVLEGIQIDGEDQWKLNWNRANALMHLGETRVAAVEFGRAFLLASQNERIREGVIAGVQSSTSWAPMRRDTTAYHSFVKSAEMFLGTGVGSMIEAAI